MPYVIGTLTGQDEWTVGNLSLRSHQRAGVSIVSADIDAIVTLQRRFSLDTGGYGSWADVESWSGIVQTSYIVDRAQQIRLGIKTGDFTSGTISVELGSD